MDEQQQSQTKPVPSAEEIARLEAEAVAALQRGEAPRRREAAGGAEAKTAPEPDEKPAATPAGAPGAFVPYVDDVPEPEPGEEPEADEPYVPGELEKRVDALTPGQWKLCQIVGGAALGLAVIAALFAFSEELAAYGLIIAALLAMLVPRYLERVLRRKLTTARYAMLIAMVIGLAVVALVIGFPKTAGGQ